MKRGLTKQEAAEYVGCDSLAAFDDWRRKGIVPDAIPGTTRWDRKALDLVLRRTSPEGLIGQVYFVTDGRDTKIGYTRRWQWRLSNLRTASPRLLRPLVLFFALPQQERQVHHYFREIRTRGEWFVQGPMIMKTVETIRSLGLNCLEAP